MMQLSEENSIIYLVYIIKILDMLDKNILNIYPLSLDMNIFIFDIQKI